MYSKEGEMRDGLPDRLRSVLYRSVNFIGYSWYALWQASRCTLYSSDAQQPLQAVWQA
jgi:hypothetical protein